MPTNVKLLLIEIFVFSLILLIGFVFYFRAFSNYQVSSNPTTGIIYGSYSNPDYGMNVNSFTMEINTQKQTINLGIDFAYNSIGNYTLLMTLPFRIEDYTNFSSGNVFVRNMSSGSIVMFTFDIGNASNYGYTFDTAKILLHVDNSILDKVFETSTLNLPFGGSVTNEISKELGNLGQVSQFTIIGGGINGTVRITIPYSAVVIGTTHQIDRRDPENDGQLFEFHINGF
jgi:hypothetical protein